MNKLCIYVTIACAFASLVTAEVVENINCPGRREGNPLSSVELISVSPCPNANGLSSSPCRMERGTNATLTVTFTPQQVHKRMKATLAWRNGAIDLPFRGMQQNACRSLNNGRCPTTRGQSHTWQAVINLSQSFPANTYPLKLKITDGSKIVVCNIFSIKLL